MLDAVIARKPDALLIAPTDKVQLIEPLRGAFNAGIPVITVDTYIGGGVYQTGSGNADFPLSYIASNNMLGGQMAARALAKAIGGKGKVYVSNVQPGVSTTDEREEGFIAEMKKDYPGITVLNTQFNDDDANKAASQAQSVLARNPISPASSAPICSRPWAPPTASSRAARAARSRSSPSMRRRRSSAISRAG